MARLSTDIIAKIAETHGFEPSDQIVIESVRQAEENHGKDCGKVYWATDYRGFYDAAKLLDGYLHETARCDRADARRADQFCRDAY